ncbi:uncharacterized protein MYCFIDRAFT_171608 [Pseudocercospora fijiensis CIRAD86]|uniref:Uncharacterized protein n=1 Tax=Pseudocercospora fijiensis (strain CIRAD86) TaxID=383855 RepID=M3AMC7_PSEFD|nr:uncharacterized protein MYCFIDRAFT_171608 [Pseudocercospora fijiensis CIRAD86]EME85731.1 hypothetical protein MYCFIDRAFT_171608 [Pseudocercospora fijiensis CIRAD86]
MGFPYSSSLSTDLSNLDDAVFTGRRYGMSLTSDNDEHFSNMHFLFISFCLASFEEHNIGWLQRRDGWMSMYRPSWKSSSRWVFSLTLFPAELKIPLPKELVFLLSCLDGSRISSPLLQVLVCPIFPT